MLEGHQKLAWTACPILVSSCHHTVLFLQTSAANSSTALLLSVLSLSQEGDTSHLEVTLIIIV